MTPAHQGLHDLQALHTLQLRSRALQLATLDRIGDLPDVLELAARESLPARPLGQGSNIVPAETVEALVVQVALRGRQIVDEDEQGVLLQVGAGENWHQLVQYCVEQGWHGLENLALIPGLAGAAPIQNIGAYGAEVADCIDSVQVMALDSGRFANLARERGWHADKDGVYCLARAQCRFGYRDSIFKRELRGAALVVSLRLRLSRQFTPLLGYPALAERFRAPALTSKNRLAPPSAREVMQAVVDIRRSKLPDPADTPNAGSFFKNPVVDAGQAGRLLEAHPGMPVYPLDDDAGQCKLSAGWLIEQSGFRGADNGRVGMYRGQALVLVNHRPGVCSAADVLDFAGQVAGEVNRRFGVDLEREPELFG